MLSRAFFLHGPMNSLTFCPLNFVARYAVEFSGISINNYISIVNVCASLMTYLDGEDTIKIFFSIFFWLFYLITF